MQGSGTPVRWWSRLLLHEFLSTLFITLGGRSIRDFKQVCFQTHSFQKVFSTYNSRYESQLRLGCRMA